MPTFYEFFAGGGMARAGLGGGWRCAFANDFDPMKAAAYEANWGAANFRLADVARLTPDEVPGEADLAWASFPCQDLSLAGQNKGLGAAGAGATTRSGTFWHFWHLMQSLSYAKRGPRLIVLENVCGTLTSHDGADFDAILTAFAEQRYRVGALVLDAALFVPHSRKRLFIIGVRHDVPIPASLTTPGPHAPWHPAALQKAQRRLGLAQRAAWLWWQLPAPPPRRQQFLEVLEPEPADVKWHTSAETARLLSLMSAGHQAKVRQVVAAGQPAVGGIYRRMRLNEQGEKTQRAEVRFDSVAGCLRTGSGGSSKQLLLLVEGERLRSRLLSAREAARLMGLPDSYALPARYGDAYHLLGDGVVVPVVRYLAQHLLEPLLAATPAEAVAGPPLNLALVAK